MNDKLFHVESIYDPYSDSRKLQLLCTAGAEMRAAQNGYFSAKDFGTKKEFMKLSKAKEAAFDKLVKEFSVK